jgi:hypothetical protein
LSLVFPVKDAGQVRYVGYLGFSQTSGLSEADLLSYMSSVDRFARIDPRVEIGVANHPMSDGLLFRRAAMAQRKSADAHPFVIGNDGFRKWLAQVHDCAGEVLDQMYARMRNPATGRDSR